MNKLALSLLLALASLGPTETAHASGAPSFDDGAVAALVLSTNAMLAGGAFVVIDLVWALRGKPLPVGLAYTQLFVPTTLSFLAAGAIMSYSGSAGAFFLLGGTYFATHSILTLALRRDEVDARDPPRRAPPPRAVVSIAPLPNGATLIARGVF